RNAMRWTGNRKPRATTERSQLTSFHLPKRTRIDNAAKSKFEQQENEGKRPSLPPLPLELSVEEIRGLWKKAMTHLHEGGHKRFLGCGECGACPHGVGDVFEGFVMVQSPYIVPHRMRREEKMFTVYICITKKWVRENPTSRLVLNESATEVHNKPIFFCIVGSSDYHKHDRDSKVFRFYSDCLRSSLFHGMHVMMMGDGDQFTIIDLVENDCQIFDKMKTTIDAFKDLYDKTIASRRFQHSKRVASNR
ncbi:hypothetical protein GOP47_0023220, partial [Adiantum capillus-veneris]